MKNFFKKLAFVMALAMVITSLAPAAGVFAAKAPKLNAKSATLLLGNKKRNNFDFNLANKVKGSTYKWTTSNKKVATVAQNGVVKAVANGTATIKLAIKLPTGKTTTLSATVTVKTNANSVEITNLPEGAIKVGAKHNFNRSYTTVAGTKTTDVTKFVITSDNADKATIKENGVFTAKEPGEYTIKAYMAQSNLKMSEGKYTAESKEVTVNVAGMTEVKQLNTTKFQVTFGSKVTAEELKALTVSYLVGTTKVSSLVKEIKVDETGKVATVELYVPFVEEAQYVIAFDGTEKTFTSAKVDAKEVASIQILTNEVVYNAEAKDLDIALYNKDGVNITTPTLLGRVDVEILNNIGYVDGLKVILFNKGDVADVKATFHTYEYDETSFQEIVKTAQKNIVAVDETVHTVGNAVEGTILKVANATTAPDWAKAPNTVLAAGDNNYKLFTRIKKTDNKTFVYSYDFDSSNLRDEKITFTSSDENVLVVYPDGTLYPVKEGNAVVVVSYDGVAKGAINVTIRGERKVATVTLDKYSAVVSNTDQFDHTATFKLSVKDTLGADYTDYTTSDFYFEAGKNNPDQNVKPAFKDSKTIEFVGNSVGTEDGTYTFFLKGLDKTVLFTINVQEPNSTTPSYYKVEVDNKTVDLAVAKDDVIKNVNVSIMGYAPNNVVVTKATLNNDAYYKLTRNGKEVTDASLLDGKIEVVSGSANQVVGKLEKGNYGITAHRSSDDKVIGTASFTVVDTTAKATFTVSKTETEKTTVFEAVKDAYKFFVGGSEVKDLDIAEVTYVENGVAKTITADTAVTKGKVVIKSVTFNREFAHGTNTYLDAFAATVNQTLLVK